MEEQKVFMYGEFDEAFVDNLDFYDDGDYEDEDFEFDVNAAALWFEDQKLIVSFGDGRTATMELPDEEDYELVKVVLADVNFWANFLTSLSAGIEKHK